MLYYNNIKIAALPTHTLLYFGFVLLTIAIIIIISSRSSENTFAFSSLVTLLSASFTFSFLFKYYDPLLLRKCVHSKTVLFFACVCVCFLLVNYNKSTIPAGEHNMTEGIPLITATTTVQVQVHCVI